MLTIMSVASLSAEELRIAVLRVAFQPDASPATTGDGSFVMTDTFGLVCDDWTLDPPPHGRQYFQDHLVALDNYWQRVSGGQVYVNIAGSDVYPLNSDDVYTLPHDMLYYHPYLEDFDETEKLFELSRDAIELADPHVDFSQYTTVILAHAGMGGDFAFALDPTPGNIPSAYLSQVDFNTYGNLETDEGSLSDLIIVPESQNFLQFRETRSLFEDAEDPCFYQVGLNGTLALMIGFHLDLPPLYDTETGVSLVGGFALMDQGSNNFHGIVPAYPDPYTRISKGWVLPVEKGIGDSISIHVDDAPVKVSISDTEYYLIENRQRNILQPAGMTEWIDEAGYDTVSVELSNGGVVLSVDEQHAGLPGNGLNIWHVDETAWFTQSNPNGGSVQMVDLVEADGAQDMGHTTQLLFADYLETGWWFDTWFAGNEGWFHLNRYQEVVGDSLLYFSTSTFPSTHSTSGTPTHLRIENISRNGSTMHFSITSERLVEKDSISTFIGWGGDVDRIWAFNADSSAVVEATYQNGRLIASRSDLVAAADILTTDSDSTFQFRYPYVFPNLDSGTRFLNIETGSLHSNPTKDDAQEIIISRDALLTLSYVGRNSDGTYSLIKYYGSQGQQISQQVPEVPVARFQTTSGIQPVYGAFVDDPTPVGVTPYRDPNGIHMPVPESIDMITWPSTDGVLLISHLPTNDYDFLALEQPSQIIPLDADSDGHYELALFYENSVRIINQAGVDLNGSPFAVEPYMGNPLIGSLVNGIPALFLRHVRGYSIHGFDGKMLDRGVLKTASENIENYLNVGQGLSLIRSGEDLLYFEYDEDLAVVSFWSAPAGNAAGDRTVIVPIVEAQDTPEIDPKTVYNYPNPVKGDRTTIRAWLGDVEDWTIEIFSLNGAQVAWTERQVFQKNSYNEWVWNTSDVSNGVYLAQITAGGSAEIIKIAVIR